MPYLRKRRVGMGDKVICTACKGTGVYTGTPDFIGDRFGVTCSYCDTCNGTGFVEVVNR